MRRQTAVQHSKKKRSRDVVSVIGDLLPIVDVFSVLLAAAVATMITVTLFDSDTSIHALARSGIRAVTGLAVLTPIVLHDGRFVAFASSAMSRKLWSCFAIRAVILTVVVMVAGLANRYLDFAPHAWVFTLIAATLLVAGLARWLLVSSLRRLERRGVLVETVAIVGPGPSANRIASMLRRTRGDSVDVVGIFGDDPDGSSSRAVVCDGTVDDLVELGKHRYLDWIVVASPPAEQGELLSLVHRLKALSVPIGLCPDALDDELDPLSVVPARRLAGPRMVLPRHEPHVASARAPWFVALGGQPLLLYRHVRVNLRIIVLGRWRRAR